MKKILFLILTIVLIFSQLVCQEKKFLTIDEAVVGLYRELYPEYMKELAFRPTTKAKNNEISYIKNNALYIKEFDLKSIKTEEKLLISVEDLNKIFSTVINPKIEFTIFPTYEWIDNEHIKFNYENSVLVIDVVKKEKYQSNFIPEDANYENITLSPKGGHYCYTIENNLYIVNFGKKTISTNDLDKNHVYGQTVSRNEFGINGGIFWSPKAKYLAFYRKDETNVSEYPIVNTKTRIATATPTKYPMAGELSEKVTIGVYSIENDKFVYLNTGNIEEGDEYYLPCVSWSPDEKYIYAAKLNHKQNHFDLLCFEPETGNFVKKLFEENNDRYVEPSDPMIFLPNDPTKFIWQTRKDGYSHLYLYETDGKLIRQLTKGNFEVQEVYGFSPDGKFVFVKANKETPINFDIYKVTIANGTMKRLTKENGTHNAIFSPDYNDFIDNYSNTTTPNVYNLCNTDGIVISNILTSKNPLIDYEMPDCQISTIKANDGQTDLYYRLITPKNLDKNKKYPCIVYVYGGPHAQLITNRWLGGASGWDYYMAQRGYIVFTIDNRGSSNRGFDFESIIHRQLGNIETQDQLSGINFLKSLNYIDMERIGVHGWSYGGFLTTTLICDYPNVFKVGVAGGPVINWELYEVMYGERYMDTPQENPDGYKTNNLLNKAKKLKNRLMIIHGAIDPTVVWQNSQNFIDECIKQKILIDYMIYPSHEHNVRGLDRIHLMRTVSRYFEEHL